MDVRTGDGSNIKKTNEELKKKIEKPEQALHIKDV